MKPLAQQNHYEVLELQPSASPAEIDRAYEKLRRLLGPGSLAVYSLVDPADQRALLLRLEEAHAILADAASRRAYDRSLGLEVPEEPEPPKAPLPSFRDAVERITRASSGERNVVEAAEPLEPEDDALELGDDDLLEVLEADAILDPDEIGLEAEAEEEIDRLALPPAPPPEDEPATAESKPTPAESEPATAEPPTPEPLTPGPIADLDAEPNAWSGEHLRAARLARGLSVDELSRRTRINVQHLENLESEHWRGLPERVFLRGMLNAYARELRLDPQRVCETYLARREKPGSR